MMKKKLIQFSVLIFLFFISAMLTISLSELLNTGAFSTSFHLSNWILMSVLSFISAVTIHELGHAVAFVLQGVRVKAIFILFFGVIFRRKRIVVFDITMLLFLGGIVIPKAFLIHDQLDLESASKKLRVSLMSGPIISYIWLLMIFVSVFFIKTPIMIYSLFWTLTYTMLFTRSFLIKQGLMIGDIRAYQFIKDHEAYLILILLQLSKQQGHDHQTGVFLYEKARLHLNHVPRIQTRKDYLLLQYVCDGYRLGYLKKIEDVPSFIQRVSIKRRIPKQYMSIIPTLLYVLIMYEKMDTATHLYQFMLHYNDEPINEFLLHTYVFNDPLNPSDFDAYVKMHAMYKHTMNISFVYEELIKKANDISFACTL